MKADQYAMYVQSASQADLLKRKLNLQNAAWINDRVTAQCRVVGHGLDVHTCVYNLSFCDAMGIQFEIIRVISGPAWFPPTAFIGQAHFGYHLDKGEEWPDMSPWPLVQECLQTEHTNPALIAAKKTYQYRIYKINEGCYWKFIRRVIDGVPQ